MVRQPRTVWTEEAENILFSGELPYLHSSHVLGKDQRLTSPLD